MKRFETLEYALGKAPKHIGKQDILPFFVYAYELTWTLPMFHAKKDEMISLLEGIVKNEGIDTTDLSAEKCWWLYMLVTMREMLKYHSADYATLTAQHVLRKVPSISEENLSVYANMLHSIMLKDIPDVMVIRPLELHAIESTLMHLDPTVKFFLERKDRFIKVVKAHLIQKDLMAEYFDEILIRDKKILRKFSNMWNAYFEVFMHFFISTYDYKLSPEHMEEKALEKAISDLILYYLGATVQNKPRIEDLHTDLNVIVQEIKELRNN